MRFLSPAWLDCMASSTALAATDVSLAVHQRITAGPEGDVEFTLRLRDGTVSVEPGPGAADVEILEDYDTAAAISQGHLSPARAFAAGRLRLSGDVGLLVEHQEALAAIGKQVAGMAEATTY